MTLVKFNPAYSNSFNALIENFFGRTMDELFDSMANQYTMPAVNIYEAGNAYKVEVAAPGLKKENFNIEVNNNVLTIQYKQMEENKTSDEQNRFYKREFRFANFRRSFTLPKNVNLEGIQASYTDGILTVEVPKKEEAKNTNAITVAVN